MPAAGPPVKTRAKQLKRKPVARPRVRAAPRVAPQAQYYVSQGKSVERQANRQRREATQQRRAAARTPTRTQRRNALLQRRAHVDQGRAVRRVAKLDKTIGPGEAPRNLRSYHRADIGAATRAREYVSQGKAVEKAATRQKAKKVDFVHETDPKVLKAAGFKKAGLGEKLASLGPRMAANAPKDAAELAITTPTSVAHIVHEQGKGVVKSVKEGSPAPIVKTQVKLAKEMVAPYKEAVKHPEKFVEKHPITAGLMFAPAVKVPLRAAGRGLRVAGKQSLRSETVGLEGTTLKEHRPGAGREAIPVGRNAAKKLRQRKTAQHITDDELDRRVDEFYDRAEQHKQAAVGSKARELKKRKKELKQLPRVEREQVMDDALSGARGGAQKHVKRQLVHEFGSHWHVHHQPTAKGKQPKPILVKPKNAREGGGIIHADRADAQHVADAVPFKAKVVEIEGAKPGETGGYGVVPERVAQRFGHHQRVGTSPATGAALLRTTSGLFRKTVLPMSPRWLGGQIVEGAMRSLAQGVTPASFMRYRRVLRELEKRDPEAAKQFRQRVESPSQFGISGPMSDWAVGRGKTFEQEFGPTGLAKPAQRATAIGRAPVIRHIRQAHRRYASTVFNDVNGRIEAMYRRGQAGKAIGSGPLLERRVLTMSDKAIKEAAEGLRNTSSQVELARTLERTYGKYSGFGPHARETILHSTPFIPWFLNMGRFLTSVLPRDHPVAAGLLADLNKADQEWRKRHKVSLYGKDHVPDFLMGSLPVGKGHVRVGGMMPFAPGDPIGDFASQVAPQMMGPLLNLMGVDWKMKQLPGGPGRRISNAVLSGAESLIPGVAQLDRISGLGAHYVQGKEKVPTILDGKPIGEGVKDVINPVRVVKGSDSRKTSKKRKAKRKSGGAAGALKTGGGGASGLLK